MASNNTTPRDPASGDRRRMGGDHPHPTSPDRAAGIVLGAAVIAMGLLAGLFYDWSIAVMPGLTAADDRTLVDAMQQMIDKIENPAFFLIFFGAPALAAVALFQARRSGPPKTAGWIVAGLALYTMTVVVTFAFHFPLNEDLVKAGDPDQIENLAAVRDDFVAPWVAWNIVRTLASTAAFGSLVWALVLHGRMGRAQQPHGTRPRGYAA
ncbi:anthrone oxygenase family protein [Micromonospora sp. CPCC 206061]|uniref:anthrone oxygenase family protein n=1 Tax=Micromonospora sp. CPCC 206061 TaxID=3122410 RepID=UPI002FEEA841